MPDVELKTAADPGLERPGRGVAAGRALGDDVLVRPGRARALDPSEDR